PAPLGCPWESTVCGATIARASAIEKTAAKFRVTAINRPPVVPSAPCRQVQGTSTPVTITPLRPVCRTATDQQTPRYGNCFKADECSVYPHVNKGSPGVNRLSGCNGCFLRTPECLRD